MIQTSSYKAPARLPLRSQPCSSTFNSKQSNLRRRRSHRKHIQKAMSTQKPTDTTYKETLSEVRLLDVEQLRHWLKDNRARVSLSFLLWLSQREQEASGEAKKELNTLGSRLTGMREGLDPVVASELLESLQRASINPLQAPESSKDAQSELEQRQLELTRRRLHEALSPAELDRAQERAEAFSEEIRERKANSLAQVLGRAPAELASAQRGLNAAAAAERILDVLLSIPSREERLAILPEAFTRPSTASEAGEGEELISTTPMQLLQAVSLYLSKLERGIQPVNGQLALPGASLHLDRTQLKDALHELKGAIFECWEAPA